MDERDLKNRLIGLKKRHFKKDQRWRIDQDYIDKLTPEQAEWLAQFNREYVGREFTDYGDDLHSERRKKEVKDEVFANRKDLMSVKSLADLEAVFANAKSSGRQAEARVMLMEAMKSKRLRHKLIRILRRDNVGTQRKKTDPK